jgi:hypothetical protein
MLRVLALIPYYRPAISRAERFDPFLIWLTMNEQFEFWILTNDRDAGSRPYANVIQE